MLEVLSTAGNVLAVRASGVVNVDDVRRIESALQDVLENQSRVGLVVDLSEIEDVTADAVAEDLRLEIGLLDKLDRFPKMALVTDREWLATTARLFARLMPQVEFRIFEPDQREQALSFASDIPPERPLSVLPIETGSSSLLAYELNGRMEESDMPPIVSALREAFDREGKIDLLVRATKYDGFDPAMMFDRSLLSMKIAAMDHVRRYAVVGAPAWMATMVELVDPLVTMQVRCFESDDEDAAWAWLRGDPETA